MPFDLFTLYLLAVGTLLLSAALTAWERQVRAQRRAEMSLWVAGYVALAFGCAFAAARASFPGALGSALGNFAMLCGYMLIFKGIAALSGRRYRGFAPTLLAVTALAWILAGASWQTILWNFASSVPIATVNALMTCEILRAEQVKSMRSRRIVAIVTGTHALFYFARAFLLPILEALFGPTAVAVAAEITMYEGVLYSVSLPMGLLAVVREEAHEQLLCAARTDHLTGLGNRRSFFDEGEALLRDHRRPIALLAFDLDHFKSINDRLGHATGDEVLKLFARIVKDLAGADAILARIGGEEFAAILPNRGRGEARLVGQSIANGFAQAAARSLGDQGLRPTVSVGVAEYGPDGATLSDLLSAADRALYAAKAGGRNRIECVRSAALVAAG